jgi:hypothetical protein
MGLGGCGTKAQKVDRVLQALNKFTKDHPDYQAKCVPHSRTVGVYDDIEHPDATNLLSGRRVTAEERAEYVAKTKARAAECKPLDEQYLQTQQLLGKGRARSGWNLKQP